MAAECRNCGAMVRPAKTREGEVVPLDSQPEVYDGGNPSGFYRILDGHVNPMIVEPVNTDRPGQFYRKHECDARPA